MQACGVESVEIRHFVPPVKALSGDSRQNGAMSTLTEQFRTEPAYDDVAADVFSGHLESRRFQRRMTLAMSLLATFVLVSSLASGIMVAEAPPELTIFAGRV